MATKVRAAQRAARSGAATLIASGREPDVLMRLAAGEPIGSCLVADLAPLAARKQWMVDQLLLRGRLVLDSGAVRVLRQDGKSLLPIGVVRVEGEFERGDVVSCIGPDGAEVARGLVNYGASDARRIARRPSSEIEGILGFVEEAELIHRDNLILLDRPL
jgi:glutamate 5-kinase